MRFWRMAAIVSGLVALALVPTPWLEHAPTVCLYRNLFGLRCPGCGMTRALSALLHGEFAQAFLYNRLVVVAFPAILGVVLFDVTTWARSGRRIPKL
jgi:hypothetical protein